MAHYAFLDKDYIVTEVIVGVDENELIEGKSPEEWYGEFRGQTCKRTSYNTIGNQHRNGKTPFRGNFAGIGFKYDNTLNAFIQPQPFPSWKLNYKTFLWEPPIVVPERVQGFTWFWSEPNQEWIKLENR